MDIFLCDVPGVYNLDSCVNFDGEIGMSFTLTGDGVELNDL